MKQPQVVANDTKCREFNTVKYQHVSLFEVDRLFRQIVPLFQLLSWATEMSSKVCKDVPSLTTQLTQLLYAPFISALWGQFVFVLSLFEDGQSGSRVFKSAPRTELQCSLKSVQKLGGHLGCQPILRTSPNQQEQDFPECMMLWYPGSNLSLRRSGGSGKHAVISDWWQIHRDQGLPSLP